MAKRELHAQALELRKQGMSYSQIKSETGVSKGTLSLWLRAYPLPEERIRELRDTSEQRIERTRDTKARKREIRHEQVREKVEEEIGILSDRDLFISGLFLYWGEGTKTSPGTVSVSNTDPAVLQCFMRWLKLFGVSRDRLRVYVHLYSDMNIEEELNFWSEALDIPRTAFRKPYVKESKRSDISYAQKFTHGTCNVIFLNQEIHEYILTSLEYLRTQFALVPTT